MGFEQVARGPRGTLNWITQRDITHIKTYFGSLHIWKTIRGWEGIDLNRPSDTPIQLDHGYDETKSRESFTIKDALEAALFRGGKCLSSHMVRGDWQSPLRWRCHEGHEFPASLNLILKGGHWCPVCMADTDSYNKLASHSPFFHQVWERDLYTAPTIGI